MVLASAPQEAEKPGESVEEAMVGIDLESGKRIPRLEANSRL